MKLAIYGKGGIGKSTISCNISIALARRGRKVLQIGCDPKHDSTFTLTGFLIPTIIDTLQTKDYHYENVWPEDVIYEGYGGVSCVEAGGPPAGAGCGGYVVGETVKLLKELNAFYEYDVILFDVLGDVVCGGFAAPLNYADYCIIITDNGFDALFAANRIVASVREKARTNPLRLAGLIGNRTVQRDLIDKFVALCPMPVLEIIPLEDSVRISRVKGKTLFEMAESEPENQFMCDFYLNIADQLLSQPEGVVANDLPDRELFSLLSHFMSDQDDPLLMNDDLLGRLPSETTFGRSVDDESEIQIAYVADDLGIQEVAFTKQSGEHTKELKNDNLIGTHPSELSTVNLLPTTTSLGTLTGSRISDSSSTLRPKVISEGNSAVSQEGKECLASSAKQTAVVQKGIKVLTVNELSKEDKQKKGSALRAQVPPKVSKENKNNLDSLDNNFMMV